MMKRLVLLSPTLLLAAPVWAGISGISVINNSSVTGTDGSLATRYGEFATQSTVGPVNTSAGVSSFTHQMRWYNGYISNVGGVAQTHARGVHFDLLFTVEDPLNQGYQLQIGTVSRGYSAAQWGSSAGSVSTVGTTISGRLDTDMTDANNTLGTQLGGLTHLTSANTSANEATPFSRDFDERSASLNAGTFFGTRSFGLRFTTAGSGQTNVFMANGVTGQGSVLFGLANLDSSLNPTAAPQGGDAFAYSDLGHFATITATKLVPEPSTWALLAGVGVLGAAMIRRRFKA